MKRFITLPMAALVLAACADTPVAPADDLAPQFKATVNHIEAKVPLAAFAAFIPCANGGAGEWAVVTGPELHIVAKLNTDAKGGVHASAHFQPIRNWDGIGQVTGDVYQATGVTRNNINIGASGFPIEFTAVNNFRWIGPGPGNNLLVHSTQHITIDANGNVRATPLNASVDCK